LHGWIKVGAESEVIDASILAINYVFLAKIEASAQ